jgi:hypothetical protein
MGGPREKRLSQSLKYLLKGGIIALAIKSLLKIYILRVTPFLKWGTPAKILTINPWLMAHNK